MSTGVPKAMWWARAWRSPPALLAEYGVFGSMGDLSVKRPLPIEPYTSSVLTWTRRSAPHRRTASHSTKTP